MDYSVLLGAHSHTRWLVLVAGVLAMVLPQLNQEHSKKSKLPALVFMIVCDLQLTLGFLLYFGDSSFGIKAFSEGIGHVMSTSAIRKIAVEHFVLMLVAFVMAHVAYAKIKNTDQQALVKKFSLIFIGISMVCLLAGIPWSRF